jgi:hypothetical protein
MSLRCRLGGVRARGPYPRPRGGTGRMICRLALRSNETLEVARRSGGLAPGGSLPATECPADSS